MERRKSAISFLLIFLFLGFSSWSQEVSFEAMRSLDEWRWGVIAYNDGLPGKSLLAMERAVSLNPTDPSIREWLGRAYWKSGMESAALAIWDELIAEGGASAVLQNRADRLRYRLSGEDELPNDEEWIPLATFQGGDSQTAYFQRPAAVRSLNDKSGSLIVTSYTGGELVQLDANGALIERFEGGIDGLLQPFDVLPIGDGKLLVSEFQADSISVLALDGLSKGYRLETWGETGSEKNQFLGPQYMAPSPDGLYVYVSDWGNRRVAKWSLDGTHVLNFKASGNFRGFRGPTGIACLDDKVYVADSLEARIDVFDPSGNYLGPLVTEGLEKPEGLSILGRHLLIADGAGIFQVDTVSGELSLKTSFGGGSHRITTVSLDENGNLAVCDFNANRVVLLTPLSTLYGGLDVTLSRVRADSYPNIFVDFTVKDRAGNPITGLDAGNFQVFEGDSPIGQPVLDWQSSKDSSVSIAAVVDSIGGEGGVSSLLRGVEDLINALAAGDELSLVEAAENPVLYEVQEGSGPRDFYKRVISSAGEKRIPWDESLRLAANQIAPDRNRKAVIAFVANPPRAGAFDTYGLVETARLMANNGIVFYPVYADKESVSRELDYIAAETSGVSSFLFQPEGSGAVIDKLREKRLGAYTVAWETSRSDGFGRSFLPVSVEVIYISKSGRADSGTFAPLQ